MNSRTILAFVLFAVLCIIQFSQGYVSSGLFNDRSSSEPDLIPAASGHGGHGRVQIKVYRGPSEGHEKFAPHGYWVKQPADHHHHH